MGKCGFSLLLSLGLSFAAATVHVASARADEEPDKKTVELKATATWYSGTDLFNQQKYDEAAKLYVEALEGFDAVYGADSEKAAALRFELGKHYYEHDQVKHARRWFEDCLVSFPQSKIRTRPFADMLLALGRMYYDEGAYKRAELVLRRCVDIRTESLKDESEETLFALHLLGNAQEHQYKFDDALKTSERALEVHGRVLPKQDKTSIALLRQGAKLHHVIGNVPKSLEYTERSLPLVEAEYGPESQEYASSLQNLAALNAAKGNKVIAAEQLNRSLAIHEALYGKDSPRIVPVIRATAVLASNNREFERAENLLTRCLELLQQEGDASRQDVAELYVDLADVALDSFRSLSDSNSYVDKAVTAAATETDQDPEFRVELKLLQVKASRESADLHSALEHSNQAVLICEQYFPHGVWMARSLKSMADVQLDLCDYMGANATLDRASELAEKQDFCQDAAGLLALRAYVLIEQGKYSQAEEHVESMMKSAGDRVSRVTEALFARAKLRMVTNDYDRAMSDLRQAIKNMEDMWGTGRPRGAEARAALASALRYSGDCQTGHEEILPAYDVLVAYYGTDHLRTASVSIVLAKILADEGKFDEALAMCKAAVDVYRKRLGDNHKETREAAEAYEGIECLMTAAAAP